MFFIDVDATGIDSMKDRIIRISVLDFKTGDKYSEIVGQVGLVSTAVMQLVGISSASLSHAKRFSDVMSTIFLWMDERCPDKTIHLISHNGHRFTFPILTKEIRRYKVVIKKTFVLWDSIYTLRKYGVTSLDTQTNCIQRMHILFELFKEKTGHDFYSEKGIQMIREDNQKHISEYPQPPFETKFIRVN